jgi:kinesin family protein 2/24
MDREKRELFHLRREEPLLTLTLKSGNPPISSSILAPIENGTQLCKLPKGEFVSRCLKTPNVSPEHARAFYDKLWRLHIDSRTAKSAAPSGVSSAIASEDDESVNSTVPFQERLQPGMIVRVKLHLRTEFSQFAMVLSPEGAFEKDPVKREEMMGKKRFVCAQIVGAVMADAYDLAMEVKKVIAVADMEAEVFMEWDPPTRYWFMTI